MAPLLFFGQESCLKCRSGGDLRYHPAHEWRDKQHGREGDWPSCGESSEPAFEELGIVALIDENDGARDDADHDEREQCAEEYVAIAGGYLHRHVFLFCLNKKGGTQAAFQVDSNLSLRTVSP